MKSLCGTPLKRRGGLKGIYLFFSQISVLSLTVALYCLLYPLEYISFGGAFSITRLLYALILFSALINIKKLRLPRIALYGQLFFFLLFLLIDVGISKSVSAGSSFFKYFMNVSLTLIVAAFRYTNEESKLIERAFILSSFLIFALYLANSGSYSTATTSERVVAVIEGSATDPNTFCTYFLPAVAYCYFRFLQDGKAIYLIGTFLFVVVPLNAGSRGGLLGFFAVLVSVFIMHSVYNRAKVRTVIIGLISVAALYCVLSFVMASLSPGVAERFSLDYLISHGDSGRSAIRSSLVRAFLQFDLFNILFGQGLAATPLYNPGGFVAHNTLLESLIEMGLVGTLLLVLVYVTSIVVLVQHNRPYFAGTLFALFVMGFSLSLNTWKTVWIIFMISCVISSCESQGDLK